MKKHFLVATLGIAIVTLAVSFSSCKKDNDGKGPKKNQTTHVEKLSVEPTEMMLKVGERKDFKVSIEPLGVKYEASIDKTNIATLEDMTVVAVAKGTATLTVKAGDKTTTISITVVEKEKGKVNNDKLGGNIYFTDPDKFEEERADIYATMRSLGWTTVLNGEETEDNHSDAWDPVYAFFKTDQTPGGFMTVQYVWKPDANSIKFGTAIGFFEKGTMIYEKLFPEGFEKTKDNYCKAYGLTFKGRGKLADNTPCVVLAKENLPGIEIIVFSKIVKGQNGKPDAESLVMNFYKPQTQSSVLKDLSADLNIKVPSQEEIKAFTKRELMKLSKHNLI